MKQALTTKLSLLLYTFILLIGCDNGVSITVTEPINFVQVTIHSVESYISMDALSAPDIFVKVIVDGNVKVSPTYDDTYKEEMEWSCVFSTTKVTLVTIQVYDEDVTEHDYIGGCYTDTKGDSREEYKTDKLKVLYSVSYY